MDVTTRVSDFVGRAAVSSGLCHLFMPHTTAALALAGLEPGSDADFLDAFEAIIPKLDYRHAPQDHMPAHIMSAILGVSPSVPIVDGSLALGRFQRIVLFELDGPRELTIRVTILPVSSPAHPGPHPPPQPPA